MRRIQASILCVLIVGMASCGRFGNDGPAADSSVRIVCVSKQLNEILFALGAGGNIVGVDLSSTYPPEIASLPTVGYHRLLSAEGITSLHPTVVIHDGNVAPEAVLNQLKEVGIPLREYRAEPTIGATKDLMKTLGREFHAEGRADTLCAELDRDLDSAAARLHSVTTTPRVLILHFGRVINNYLVMGRRGTASALLTLAGGVNATDATEGMKPLSAELVAGANPDVLLITDFGYDRLSGIDAAKQLPGVALTAAAKNNRIYRVEEHDLVYFGPRTGKIVMQLMDLIHQ